MQYVTSHVARRIIGRFEQGDLLPDALIDLCKDAGIGAGQIRAQGVLSHVELGVFSIEEGTYREVFAAEGAFELLSFEGVLSTLGPELLLNAHLLVAYAGHAQSHVVGGQLRAALVHAVDFVIDVFEDVRLTRILDPLTQLPLLEAEARPGMAPPAAPRAVETRPLARAAEPVRAAPAPRPPQPAPRPMTAAPRSPEAPSRSSEPPPRVKPSRPAHNERTPELPPMGRPEPEPEPVAVVVGDRDQTVEPDQSVGPEQQRAPVATESDWAQAARRSQQLLSDAEMAVEWVDLEPGDILLHPRLGECIVMRVDDDTSAYIRIKKSRRISKLALTVIRLEQVEERDGKRVFEVRAGGA